MTSRYCVARKVYTLQTDAPDDAALIALAESQGEALDTPDIGDAMGRFIELLDEAGEDDALMIVNDGVTATISYEFEPFDWGDGPAPSLPRDWESHNR